MMRHPTSPAKRARKRFHARAAEAGHAAFARTKPASDGGSWTQYVCGCGRYTSRTGRAARARAGWVSHVRQVVTS